MGGRLGPSADGPLSQTMQYPPPALRKSSSRDVASFLIASGQEGNIPTMGADASFGSSTMEYRSS